MKKLFLLMFVMVFLVVPISAEVFTIDNKLTYSNKDLKVNFDNLWGFGKYYGSIELKSHPSVNYIKEVGAGNPVVMWYDFQDWEYYKDGLGEVIFTDKKTGEIINRDYSYVYWGDKIRDVYGKGECNVLGNQTQVCETIVVGTETYKDWLSYNSKDIPKGDIRIGIKVEVRIDDYVDGIWEIVGKKVSKHSIWTASLNAQLVDYWKLDGTSGDVLDSITQNNNGTNDGADRGITGKIGNAFRFIQADTDKVNFTANTSLIAGDLEYTVGFWFNASLNGITNRSGGDQLGLFTHSGNGNEVMILSLGTDEVLWRQNSGGVEQFSTAVNITGTNLNNWHFVLARHYANGTFDLRVDNQSEAGSSGTWVVSGVIGFRIGTNMNPQADQWYSGLIDEVSVWTRYLTDAESTQLYNDGNGITFTDVFSPNITLNSPVDTFNTTSQTIVFNATVFDLFGNNIVSVNLSIDGIFNETNISGINNTDYIFTKTLSFATHNWTIDACDDAGICSNGGTRTLTISRFIENSQTFNTSSFETAKEIFTINITTNGTIPTSTKLIYDGTTFLSTTITNTAGNDFDISRTIDIPLVNETKTWFFNFTINGLEISSSTQNQIINATNFTLCNAELTVPFLNITFKDEGNLSDLNASIPTSEFVYYLGSGTVNKTLEFINNTDNANYAFCSTPNRTLNVDPRVQYKSGASYPQRIWDQVVQEYTNTTTQQVLFLLSSADGIFVTFQVINQAEQPLKGVVVTGTRIIEGSEQLVASGTTSAAGSVTFWLNPDFSHTFTFVKEGFTTFVTSLFPNLPTFTIQLGVTTGVVQDFTQGISYTIRPAGDYLEQNTNHTFNFTLSSTFFTVDQFGITLRFANGTEVGTNTSTSNGGTLSLFTNVSNDSKIFLDFNYLINETFSNGTRTWIIQDLAGSEFSILRFFTDLSLYIDAGLFGLDDFGKAFLSFIILLTTVGILSARYGIASEAAMMGIIFGIVLFLDVGIGLIPNPDFGGINRIDNFISVLTGIILISILIREETR